MLALYYAQEIGNLPMDERKAIKLLEAAACQGYGKAQNNLGILYSKGIEEIQIDYKQAYAWFSTAYSNGISEANNSLESIALKMSHQKLKEAKKLSTKYIKKYHTSANEDDTYKAKDECKVQI